MLIPMNTYSNPGAYWETRLGKHFDLSGVGYGTLGPHYNAQMYQARIIGLETAFSFIGRTMAHARLLEVGCGIGFYTEYALQHGVTDYTGLDITATSVVTLQERYPHFRFYQCDVSNACMPWDGEFDVVLAADVLFHIVDDDAFQAALHNIVSWLKPNGLFIVSDVFPPQSLQTAVHVRNRSLEDYSVRLHGSSIRVLHIEPIFAILQPPPPLPGTAALWRIYSRLWRYSFWLARWSLVDRLLPGLLRWLDRRFFLPRFGLTAPNSKWMLAVKDAA
jgi:SAM-dependent methyltransferase